MKLILIFSLWSVFLSNPCRLSEEKIPVGFLKNNNCNSSGSFCGWLVDADSSFYAITLTNGYLTAVGKGKVSDFKDSVLSFQYDRDFQIPNRLNLSYKSESKSNYDSLYIDIDITALRGNKLYPLPFVYYDGKLIGNTDSSGRFFKTLGISNYSYPTSLTVLGRSMGTPIIELRVNPSLNSHILKATVPGIDSSYCEVIGGSYDKNESALTQSFKMCYAPCKEKNKFDRVMPVSNDEKDSVIALLINAKLKQPHLAQIIDRVIKQAM